MGYKYVGLYIKEGWKKPANFYSFFCPIHGKVINYPKGYNERLECPICENERRLKDELRETT